MTSLKELTKILDSLADQLRVDRLEPHVIEAYHKYMGKKPVHVIIKACQHLRETYRPFGARDFPVLDVFSETFNMLHQENYQAMNWDQAIEHYKKRGYTIWRRGDPEPEE